MDRADGGELQAGDLYRRHQLRAYPGLLAGAGFASLGIGKKVEEPAPPKEEPKAPANDNFDATAFANVIGTQIAAAIRPVTDRMDAVTTEFATIKGKLETTENTSFSRDLALGGGGNAAHETDC